MQKNTQNYAVNPPRPGACGLEYAYTDQRPCFRMPRGYKRCRFPGEWRVQRFAGALVCPGCDRLCQFPLAISPPLTPGQEVSILEEVA